MANIAYLVSYRPDFAERIRREIGAEPLIVASDGNGLYSEEALAKLADVDALIVANEPVTEQVFAACGKLKIVQRLGVGYENVDLDAATRRGIPCCNLAGVNKEAVAEHCMAMILALARNLVPTDAKTRASQWQEARMGMGGVFELKGKALGIIGFGDIGSNLAKRARAFDMDIFYNDIRPIDDRVVESVGAKFLEKDALYATADIISINVNFNETAAGMIDAKALSLMKPGGYLICCARGGIVDEHALRDALNEGRLAGAGIDVFAEEPFPEDNPLLAAKNVLLTPHIAGASRETAQRSLQYAHDNVRRVVERGGKPRWAVNGV